MMQMNRIERAVREHVQGGWDDRAKALIRRATHDLYAGPSVLGSEGGEGIEWPGFAEAMVELGALDLPGTLWWDTTAEMLLECGPQGYTDEDTGEYVEPFYEDYVELDLREIRRMVFGRELAPYVR